MPTPLHTDAFPGVYPGPGEDDPGLRLLGYRYGQTARGWDDLFRIAPVVAGVLIASVITLRVLIGAVAGLISWNDKKSTPAPADIPKQGAFCTVGVLLHMWLGQCCLRAAIASEAMSADVAAGNANALHSHPEWRDLYNVHGYTGATFCGYAIYITIMWCAGWEKGTDKLVHHIVFLFLSVTLAGSNAFGRLSSAAMSMEISTVFMNIGLITGWMKGSVPKLVHMLCGLLFLVSFLGLRIFYFGKALALQWSEFAAAPELAPLPVPMAALCLVLYSGGWCIQVYWLGPIYHKLSETFGPKKKEKKDD